MHPMLNIAVRAARRAGSIINRAALDGGGGLKVTSKRAKDFVTQVDQAAEQAIIDIVRKSYPEHGLLAAARDLGSVAWGRLGAFCVLGLSPWEMADGSLLVQEAGRLVAGLKGEQAFLASGEIATATLKVFTGVLEALR